MYKTNVLKSPSQLHSFLSDYEGDSDTEKLKNYFKKNEKLFNSRIAKKQKELQQMIKTATKNGGCLD